jgi:hypothetical protein
MTFWQYIRVDERFVEKIRVLWGITRNLSLGVFKGEFKRLRFRRFIYHKMRERKEERE